MTLETLTVHVHMGRRYIELPEAMLPLAKEVMVLPERGADGPAWLVISHDIRGEDRLREMFDALLVRKTP
jgi:hypothetical protein